MFEPFPILTTDRLLLRKIEDSDIQHIFEGLSNPNIIKYYGVSFTSIANTQEQINWYNNLLQTNTGIWWAICSKSNLSFCGAIGINNLNAAHKNAEIGYWLLTPYWGKGYINEAAKSVCSYAFDIIGLHRIEAQVETENSNSTKALEKLGFAYEGTKRDCEIKNNKFISLDLYALLSNK